MAKIIIAKYGQLAKNECGYWLKLEVIVKKLLIMVKMHVAKKCGRLMENMIPTNGGLIDTVAT